MTDIAGERRQGGDRRARARSFHYPERRTGFRRRDQRHYDRLLERYRGHPGVIATVVAAFVALNVADLVLTAYALDRGATEANPVMAALFGVNQGVAMAFKLAVALVVAVALWSLRRYRMILELSLALVAAFVLLLGYHLAGPALLG